MKETKGEVRQVPKEESKERVLQRDGEEEGRGGRSHRNRDKKEARIL